MLLQNAATRLVLVREVAGLSIFGQQAGAFSNGVAPRCIELLVLQKLLRRLVVSFQLLVLACLVLVQIHGVDLSVEGVRLRAFGPAAGGKAVLLRDLALQDRAVLHLLHFSLLGAHVLHRIHARAHVLLVQTLQRLLT